MIEKMKIKINLKIFIFILIFLLTGQLKIYGILMFFALIHELGHLLAGVMLKFKPESLKIMPMGLCISFNISAEEYNGKNSKLLRLKKIIIASAGPITNILIIILLSIFKLGLSEENKVLYIYSNILIAIFNLLPIYPLDGGRIIKGMLNLWLDKSKTIKLTNTISNISLLILTAISSIAIYYYENISILLIIIYLWTITILQNKKDNMKLKMYDTLKKLEID